MIPGAGAAVRTVAIDRSARVRPLAGPILIAISLIHLACVPVFYGPALADIIDAGVVNALEVDGTVIDSRDAAFWYVAAGLGMVLLGYLAWWVERRIGRLPAGLGWLLVAFATANVLLFPVSGFWLFLLPAAVVLRRTRRRDDGSAKPLPGD